MGTRSDIIVHRADGAWARVYCHWDGYLEGVGATLFAHYNSQERAEELVKHGDMSSLGERCDKPDGHSYANKVEGCTVYYGRDRGETDVDATIGSTLREVWPAAGGGTEFTYVWDAGRWLVGDPDAGSEALVGLADALDRKVAVTPHIKAFGMTFGRHKAL